MTALLDRPVGRQLPAPGRHTAVRTVLSTMERFLFRGDALAVARANAWSAVQEDKLRARERAEASEVFATFSVAVTAASAAAPAASAPVPTSADLAAVR